MESDQTDARFGFSVSTARDVNRDGYDDLIVGAPKYDNPERNEGGVFVYYGAPDNTPTADWTAESNKAGTWLGKSVSTAGDVNGDGYLDVIVGAHLYDNYETNEGAVFVYLGSATGLNSTPAWIAESNQAHAQFGWAVSSAGDVNADGYDDVIVGARLYDNPETNEGRAYLYLGSATGLSQMPAWIAEGDQANAQFGWAVSYAGDVNADGYDDVIVGARLYDNGERNEGQAYLYLGSATGLSQTPAWTAEGSQRNAYFGMAVSYAGDVNGDDYDDVIIGAHAYDNGERNEGAAFVYLGSATGLESTAAWTAEGNQASALFGWHVSNAGDVNDDGYDDLIVGAIKYDNSETNEGRAFVYLGSATGPSDAPAWTAESDQANAQFGNSVSYAGDVNADGYDDVIVGARYLDNPETNEGGGFLYLGSATGLSATPAWTAESDQAYAQFGWAVSTVGDVNRDGYDDLIIGAPKYDNPETNEGRVFVYYGLSKSPSWQLVNTETIPPLRGEHLMAYHSTQGVSVLYGNKGRWPYENSSWQFDGQDWQVIESEPPEAVYGAAMAYHDNAGAIILFGGSNAYDTPLAQTWHYDGQSWQQASPSSSPSRRTYSAMVYHPPTGASSSLVVIMKSSITTTFGNMMVKIGKAPRCRARSRSPHLTCYGLQSR